MLKEYYRLAKPGIAYGNLLTTIAAYLYASRWQLTTLSAWADFLATVFGLGLVIASACVFNNYIDRDIDAKMERTKDRPLVSGTISGENAIFFGAVLALIGFALLIAFVNILSAVIAAIGFAVYVFAYTFAKRKTEWATEIGSVSGAMPIVVGYVAVTDRIDWVALILFLALIFWQMPHFFAIAFYREREYIAAGIPIPPLIRGSWQTKLQSLLYIFAFGLAVLSLTLFGFAGFIYLVVVEAATLAWFARATEGFKAKDGAEWGKKLFFASLWVLLAFSIMLSVATLLP